MFRYRIAKEEPLSNKSSQREHIPGFYVTYFRSIICSNTKGRLFQWFRKKFISWEQ